MTTYWAQAGGCDRDSLVNLCGRIRTLDSLLNICRNHGGVDACCCVCNGLNVATDCFCLCDRAQTGDCGGCAFIDLGSLCRTMFGCVDYGWDL